MYIYIQSPATTYQNDSLVGRELIFGRLLKILVIFNSLVNGSIKYLWLPFAEVASAAIHISLLCH